MSKDRKNLDAQVGIANNDNYSRNNNIHFQFNIL